VILAIFQGFSLKSMFGNRVTFPAMVVHSAALQERVYESVRCPVARNR
jgi:hypothetical protein